MHISIAVGPLAHDPPNWLKAGIAAADTPIVRSAANPRRRRELLWTRGLKANLEARRQQLGASDRRLNVHSPGRVSITHDRHFAAVAISQFSDIGLDLQTDPRSKSCYRIAETWFPNPESEEILASGSCDRFLLSWVVKEAWAKCMNRSIFETCRAIGVWGGKVRIVGGAVGASQFAWSRYRFSANEQLVPELRFAGSDSSSLGFSGEGFAMGMCLRGNTPSMPNIECLIPGPDSGLCRFALEWEWIPVASYITSE